MESELIKTYVPTAKRGWSFLNMPVKDNLSPLAESKIVQQVLTL
jgi:hypothetical protein